MDYSYESTKGLATGNGRRITAGGVQVDASGTKFISGEDNMQNWKSMKRLNFVFGTLEGSLTLRAGEARLVGKEARDDGGRTKEVRRSELENDLGR